MGSTFYLVLYLAIQYLWRPHPSCLAETTMVFCELVCVFIMFWRGLLQ